MKDVKIAITAASYSGNKGAAAMLQSSISQLYEIYGEHLKIVLMSVYPDEDKKQNPWKFARIVSAKPEQLLFIAFPLAILFYVFRWCPPVKKMLLKNQILKAYADIDAVIDEAGISFVDSRGFVMNTYAFVCMAVPLLMGKPVMKYSQALGTFKNAYNRFLAKWILPKLEIICARGRITRDNLESIGIKKNVTVCADGAFSMKDSVYWKEEVENRCKEDNFYAMPVVGISISSVVEKKCERMGIHYCDIMKDFILYLQGRGYHTLLIANAARIQSQKTRNNDLMTGDRIYEMIPDKEAVRWYHEEMDAEEIREYISKCKYLVASRFHAMIGALEKRVPVALIGWSHKYQEVLDMFELGQYAADYSKLSVKDLTDIFEKMESDEENIRNLLEIHHNEVIESSRENIRLISSKIDWIIQNKAGKGLLNLKDPERYIGNYYVCKKGYAADEKIREHAASGGMVTALLCNMLRNGDIDGAWVTKTKVNHGKPEYETYIAVTEDEIREASSSIYMQIPLLKHLDMVRNFEGRIAVVAVPCILNALDEIIKKDDRLKDKFAFKLGLYCSGEHDIRATLLPLKKAQIDLNGAKRFYYRQGLWRGRACVEYHDNTVKTFSYTKYICTYKNAYFFSKYSCFTCQDQFASYADISFGDIWLKEMRQEEIKHTGCIIRNRKAYDVFERAVAQGDIVAGELWDTEVLRSQKRALVFKFNCAKEKKRILEQQGKSVSVDTDSKCKWNHRLAAKLAYFDMNVSNNHYDKLEKIPIKFVYYYMCFIRVLLSF